MGLISFYICKASYIKCNYIERGHYENTLKNIIYNCWNFIIRIIFSNLVWWWRYGCFKRRRFWCIYGLAYFLLYWDMVLLFSTSKKIHVTSLIASICVFLLEIYQFLTWHYLTITGYISLAFSFDMTSLGFYLSLFICCINIVCKIIGMKLCTHSIIEKKWFDTVDDSSTVFSYNRVEGRN